MAKSKAVRLDGTALLEQICFGNAAETSLFI
jgi:hypothetical protein